MSNLKALAKVQGGAVMLACLVVIAALPAYSKDKHSASVNSVQALLGRWDLTLKTPQREYPSWLELTEQNGRLKALFVSRWGNARPLPRVEFANGQLTFVSPQKEEDRKDDMVFTGRLSGNRLVGTTTGPDGTPWQWTGVRAPSLKRNSPPHWVSRCSCLMAKT